MIDGLPEDDKETKEGSGDKAEAEETNNKTDDTKLETDKVADKLENLTVTENSDKSTKGEQAESKTDEENKTDEDKLNKPNSEDVKE